MTAKRARRTSENLLTRRQLATLLDKHVMTITKWEQDGLPIAERGRKGKPSLYRELDVRTWLAAREEAAKQNGHVNVAQERARKEKAQAILAEQTFAIRSRESLPRAEVERAWAAEVVAVRTIIWGSYTSHADRVFNASIVEGLAGVERTLKELAVEILKELANPDRAVEVA